MQTGRTGGVGVWQRLFRPHPQAPLTDTETGLAGAEYLLTRLGEEIARSRRHDRALYLLVLELQSFDAVAASEVVRVRRAAADELRRQARRNDVVASLGPGRFAVILTEARPDFSDQTAVRICAGLNSACSAVMDEGMLTARYGIAAYDTPIRDALSMVAQAEFDLQRRAEQESSNEA